MPKQHITAVILAGGMGRRMQGMDKGLVAINDREMISYVLESLRRSVDEVVINANRNHVRYEAFGVRVIADSVEGYQGPLAGLEAGLAAATTPWVFTCPCDSPLLSDKLLPHMWRQLAQTDAEIAVASDGERSHPVFSLVQTALLGSLRSYLDSQQRKIDRWFDQHKLLTVDCSGYAESFINVNTEQQLAEAGEILRGKTDSRGC